MKTLYYLFGMLTAGTVTAFPVSLFLMMFGVISPDTAAHVLHWVISGGPLFAVLTGTLQYACSEVVRMREEGAYYAQ